MGRLGLWVVAPEYESPVKLVVGCGLWIGWYLKSVLAGELFAI